MVLQRRLVANVQKEIFGYPSINKEPIKNLFLLSSFPKTQKLVFKELHA